MLVSERATTKKLQTCLPSCSTTFKLTCFCDFHKICPTPVGIIQSHGPIITREWIWSISNISNSQVQVQDFVHQGWLAWFIPLFHQETHLQIGAQLMLIEAWRITRDFKSSVERSFMILGEHYLRLPEEISYLHKFCNLWEMTFTGHLQGSPTVLGESSI